MKRVPFRLSRGGLVVLLAGVAGALLVLYAWRLWPFPDVIQSTENAYVRGNVTVHAPKVDGYVAEVLVKDFDRVAAGQMLVRLDDRNYLQRLEQARASLAAHEASLANHEQARLGRAAQLSGTQASLAAAQAQRVNADAQLARTLADQRRADALVSDGSVSRRERDQVEGLLRQAEAAERQARATVRQAEAAEQAARQELRSVVVNRQALLAAVEGARAAVRLAEIDLDNTRVRAARAGTVGEVGVKLGQYVTPGAQLLSLVPDEVWVIANFKEGQTRHMRPGQRASVQVDAFGGEELQGQVERLSPATGAEFSVLRPDNATGNFTKVPQRIPVRIRIDALDRSHPPLRPGMSVTARVDTSEPSR